MDLGYWRAHDFRRTLVTRLSEMNVEPHVTERMLGHELGGIMSVYNKHDWIEAQRKAYELHADKLFWHIMKWFTEFGHLNRGDMLTSEQHRCHNEKKKFQRRV